MTTPSPSETLLSRWLAQEPGAEPPEGLDAEAVEAVYALRPDLAPPHRVSIEQVLELVAEGPFAREEQAPAAALARALEGEASEDEAVEAAYALRPDLAPAHRVSIEQVLAEVKEGPFAARSVGKITPRQAQAEPRRGVVARRRVPSWAIPALGGLAVVATALMVVLPGSDRVLHAPSPFAAEEMAAADEMAAAQGRAAAPAAARPAAPDPVAPDPATTAPSTTPKASPVPGAATTGSETGGSTGSGSAGLAQAPVAEASKTDDLLRAQLAKDLAENQAEDRADERADEAGGGGGILGGLRGGEAQAPAPSKAKEAAEAEREADLDASPMEEVVSQTRATSASSQDDRETSSKERTRDEKKSEARSSGGRAKSESTLADSALAESAAAEPAPPPPAAAPASAADGAAMGPAAGYAESAKPSARAPAAPRTISPGAPSADSLETLRAQASPVGGFPDPTAGRPDVAAAHAAAAEADARQDDDAFVAALRPLLAHAQADVALDAAWRIARRQLSLGQTTSALSTLRQGLARGGSALQRARLYALEGQVYERTGNAERASESYRKAVMAR